MTLEVPDELLDRLADLIAAKVVGRLSVSPEPSPFMTVGEAVEYIRSRGRGRVDDLLSAGRLTRFKEGRRTLVLRTELEALIRKEQ